MKNKKSIIILTIFASVFLSANYAVYKTAGAHPGSTGAPGDLTCAQLGCHTDAMVISNSIGVNRLLFSNSDSTYFPGQTYTITVKVNKAPKVKFGFECQAIRDADSTNVGQIVITDPTRTQIINHIINLDIRYSATHKTAGSPALYVDSTQWVFNWTAPPINAGPITFYYATNCTNNNGFETGDRIYLSSFKIKPNPNVSIKEISNEYDLKMYFDNETREIVINYDLKGKRKVQVSLYDNLGKQIFIGAPLLLSGKQKQNISLTDNYSTGVYLLQMNIENQIVSKQVIVF